MTEACGLEEFSTICSWKDRQWPRGVGHIKDSGFYLSVQ